MQDDLDANEQLNGKTPKFVSERPEMCLFSRWLLTDFRRLSNSRPVGMDVGKIPISEITNYFFTLGTYDNDLHKFVDMIQDLDNDYISNLKGN